MEYFSRRDEEPSGNGFRRRSIGVDRSPVEILVAKGATVMAPFYYYYKITSVSKTPRRAFRATPKPAKRDPSMPVIQAEAYPVRKKSRLFQPSSSVGRWFFVYAGAVVPLVCALTAAFHPADAAWQSGTLRDYAYSLFQGTALLAFSPLMLFSTVCFCLLVYDEPKMVRLPIVRFGVYTGGVLSVSFAVLYLWGYTGFHFANLLILFCGGGISSLFIGTFISVLFCLGLGFTTFREILFFRHPAKPHGAEEILSEMRHAEMRYADGGRTGKIISLSVILVGIGLLVAVVICDLDVADVLACFSFPWGATCLVGPFCMLVAYGMMIKRVRGYQPPRLRFSLAWLFLLVIWVALFMAAWHYAGGQMLDYYRQLPTEPLGR